MRRARLILALTAAALLVFALAATPAFATTESGYVTWTVDPPNDNPPTPHSGYATTTTKCGVCHSVHQAPAAGELLLPAAAADACTYCHITTDIGVTVIYGGVVGNYTTEDNHGHQSPAVTCSSCHAVHGANTFKGDAQVKILKAWNIQETLVQDLASGDTTAIIDGVGPLDPALNDGYSWPGMWDTQDVVDAAFCTQCHPYYTDASENPVTGDVIQSDGSFETTTFATHPLKVPGGEEGNDFYAGFVAEGSTLSTTSAVAVYSTRGCYWNCHGRSGRDSGGGVQVSSYPHYDPNTARFLQAGADRDQDVANSSSDANCLMCHVWSDGQGGTGPDGGVAFPAEGGVGDSY